MKNTNSKYNSMSTITGILIFAILIITLVSFVYPIYWILPWFDNLMHFVGGFFLAFFVSAIALKFFIKDIKKEIHYFLTFLAFILLIGFLWELFEFSIDSLITFKLQNSVDTITDLIFDLLGGIFGLSIIWRFFTIKYENKKYYE